jgi:predicted GNAT family acetyltransferase
MPAEEVRDNKNLRRYEMAVGDAVVFLAYEREGDRITFTHTEVPAALPGRGVGSGLVHTALDAARREHLRVLPRCEFVASFLRHHAAYQDMVGDGGREGVPSSPRRDDR